MIDEIESLMISIEIPSNNKAQELPFTITYHYTEPFATINLPSHFSLPQAREAIRSAVIKYYGDQGINYIPPRPESIIIGCGKFSFGYRLHILAPDRKQP
jgi:hypothetical protein